MPLLWATAARGLSATPVYHRRFADGRSPNVNPTDCARVLTAGAVELGSWTPLADDSQLAAFGRISLTAHGRAGADALFAIALSVRRRLQEHALDAVPVYSGMMSLMLWNPLAGEPFANVYDWLKNFCAHIARNNPERSTVAHLRADRGDRIYLGTHSNGINEYSIFPYSLSCMPHLPVHWPLTWAEVAAIADGTAPPGITVENVAEAFAEHRNDFHTMLEGVD